MEGLDGGQFLLSVPVNVTQGSVGNPALQNRPDLPLAVRALGGGRTSYRPWSQAVSAQDQPSRSTLQ